MTNKDKNSWLPNTNQQIFKDTWKENLERSLKKGSTTTDEQLIEAMMVLSEDKKEAYVPDTLKSENLHWEWLRKLMGQSEETPPPPPTDLGSPMIHQHKYKV